MGSARVASDTARVRTQGKSGASPALSRNGKWRALPQARSPARTRTHNLPTEQAKGIDLAMGRSFATSHRRQERRPPTTHDPGSSNAVSDAPQDAFGRWAAVQAWSTDATNRLDEQDDLGFWERIAATYDEGALPVPVPAVLEPHDVVLAANAFYRTLEERNGHGWRWRRRGRIAVIWWDGPATDNMERCSR